MVRWRFISTHFTVIFRFSVHKLLLDFHEIFQERRVNFCIFHCSPLSAPPFSSLCIEGSKLHRRRRALAMKNSQLLFPIVNANASTLTTPLNFNHQNLGIKRQDSKDAHCRHPCTMLPWRLKLCMQKLLGE